MAYLSAANTCPLRAMLAGVNFQPVSASMVMGFVATAALAAVVLALRMVVLLSALLRSVVVCWATAALVAAAVVLALRFMAGSFLRRCGRCRLAARPAFAGLSVRSPGSLKPLDLAQC